MRKNVLIIGIILMMLWSSAPEAYGVSVSPSKVRMGFEPDSFYEGVARFGTGGNTNHLTIGTWGDFEIIVDKTDLYCDIEPCEIHYKVVLPESFETPGMKKGYIVATEAYEDDPQGLMFVKVSMTMPIYVDVPYPGKYLEWASIEADNVAEGESTKISGNLVSRGEETISEASGYVMIYDYKGNLVGSSSTNKLREIVTDQPLVFATLWDSGENKQGNYKAVMKITYDEEQTENTVNFKLGGLDVSMINYTNPVYLGGIKQFFVIVDSIWSEEISNARASISVYNHSQTEGEGNDETITSFETLTKPLPPWGTESLLGYLDTSLFNPGLYDAKITVYFSNQSKDYDVKINFSMPLEVDEPKKKIELFTTKNLLIVMGLVLVIMLIILLTAVIPKRKKKPENDSGNSNNTNNN